MKEKRKTRHWITVAAGFIIIGVGLGIFNNCTAAFLKPVSEALGFSRGEFALYNTISILTNMVLLPVYGFAFRRFGLKKLMLIGTIVCSMVPVLYSFSESLWQFYLIAALNGLFINSISILAVGTLISNWFWDKRGLATGIALAGSGLVSSIMVPVVTWIIENYGWRWAYRTLGIVGFAVLMPIILFVVVDRPENIGLRPYEKDGEEETTHEGPLPEPSGLSRKEAVKTPTFWLVIFAFFALSFVVAGLTNHTISYLQDLGYSPMQAGSVHSAYLFILMFTKILIGMVSDQKGPFTGAMISGVFAIVMPCLALLAYLPQTLWAYALSTAIAASAGSVLPSLVAGRYFGEKYFSSIYSLCTMAATAGAAAGSPLIGFVFDYCGSYIPAIYACIVIAVLLVAAHIAAYKLRPAIGN